MTVTFAIDDRVSGAETECNHLGAFARAATRSAKGLMLVLGMTLYATADLNADLVAHWPMEPGIGDVLESDIAYRRYAS